MKNFFFFLEYTHFPKWAGKQTESHESFIPCINGQKKQNKQNIKVIHWRPGWLLKYYCDLKQLSHCWLCMTQVCFYFFFLCSESTEHKSTDNRFKTCFEPDLVAQSNGICGVDSPVRHHSLIETDHEISSMIILSPSLIQEGQLSVGCHWLCTEYC